MKTYTVSPPSTIHKNTEVLPVERRRMREMREDGFTLAEISHRYDVPVPTVARMVEGVEER